MEREIDLRELALLLWRKIWLIAIVGIVCFVAGFLWTKMFIPKQYSSSTQIYAQSTFQEGNDTATNDISKSKQLINTYIEVLKDDAVMKSVGDELIKQFGSDAIDGASQTALLFAAAVAVAIAMVGYKVKWTTISEAIGDNIKTRRLFFHSRRGSLLDAFGSRFRRFRDGSAGSERKLRPRIGFGHGCFPPLS